MILHVCHDLIFHLQEKVLTDEEIAARDDARRIGAIIFFLGAAPSFYAQYELVWKKQWKK